MRSEFASPADVNEMDGSSIKAIVPQPRVIPVRETPQDDKPPRKQSKRKQEGETVLDDEQLGDEEYLDGHEPPCSVQLYTKVDRMIATLARAFELKGPFM